MFTYTTDKRKAGLDCDRCGDHNKSTAKSCRSCGHGSLTRVHYFPTHEAAKEYVRHLSGSPRST